MKKALKRKWHYYLFLDYNILTLKNILNVKCPVCERSGKLQRLFGYGRRVKLRRLFGFKLYHCLICKWDGYIFIYRITSNLKKILINYFITLIALYILYRIMSIIFKFYVE